MNMRKHLLIFVFLTAAAFAQSPTYVNGDQTIPTYTVAKLPANNTGFNVVIVTDGNGYSCTSGSSSTVVLCYWTGSAWSPVGGGSGGSGTVTGVLGTTNQITSDGNSVTPTLSIPATFIAPGTISAATSIDATKLLGNLPALNGSALTGYPWNVLASPGGNQTLTMTGDSTTWNWGSTNTNSFSFDTSGNPTFGLVSYTTAVTNSPTININGSYQNAGTPTFAKDGWTVKDVVGAGTNGTAVLTFAHSGSAGFAGVSFPTVSVGSSSLSGTQLTATNASVTTLFAGNSTLTSTLTKYNNVSTVRNGIGAEYYSSDLTAQSAAITATNIVASAPQTGAYRVCYSADITTAGTSSSLGGTNGFQVTYTSPTDSVAKTTVLQSTDISTGNTTATATSGCRTIYAKTATAISYTFDYTSTGTVMVYEIHITTEAL